ncbi:MAG: selenium cofactor biosynthesis protein YqeC [Actinomycetota bacterium]|nr:selenium cofactor biosynthesis protein YqeC [Actinomycetota bacterium]
MIVPIKISDIADFLELSAPHNKNHVAIVGGGGKTTILHALGKQLHGRTILTCTTKMGFDQNNSLPIHLKPDDETIGNSSIGNPIMVWEEIEGQKAIGVDPAMCDRWFTIVDNVIVEADGSRRLPFKAPAEFEPVIPSSSTLVISTIGADSLDQVISDCCHRPNLVADLAECMPHDRLTPERASRVILHSEGQKKAKPPNADFCVAITKVDNGNQHKVEVLSNLIGSLDQNTKVMTIAFEPDD